MAVFADPTGAAIGLWQPNQHIGAQLANQPGTYCWSELITSDVDAAKAFYRQVFGWDAETQGEGPRAYTEWKLGGKSIGGMMAKTDDMPADMPSFWGVYFAVDDADASVARALELGGSLHIPPTDIDPGRFAMLVDSGGATFNVLALKAELSS